MILNLGRFQAQARPRWKNLESLLRALESRPDRRLNPAEAQQLQELYAQTAADLNRVTHGALAPELRQYLERLVARAYAELYYAAPTRSEMWQPRRWLRIFRAFPESFRRQSRYFALAVLVTVLGFTEAARPRRRDRSAPRVRPAADYLRNPGQRVQARAQLSVGIPTMQKVSWMASGSEQTEQPDIVSLSRYLRSTYI